MGPPFGYLRNDKNRYFAFRAFVSRIDFFVSVLTQTREKRMLNSTANVVRVVQDTSTSNEEKSKFWKYAANAMNAAMLIASVTILVLVIDLNNTINERYA